MLKIATWRRYSAGEIVFAEGDKDRAFFVVAEGGLGVLINGVRICDLEEGECAGEMEYLAEGGRNTKVIANRDSTLIRIDRDSREWASLPCQLRLSRALQGALIERLRVTTRELSRALR